MSGSSQRRLPAVPGPSPFAELIGAIDGEIEAVEREAGRAFDVSDGRRVHRSIGGSLYTFRAELTVPLQPETPVQLRVGGESHRGLLVAIDDFDVLVHVREDVGETIAAAAITTQPAFILESLRERLLEAAGAEQAALPSGGLAGGLSGAAPAQVGTDLERATDTRSALERLDDPALLPNAAQLRAMARAAGSDLHFVWGPPGTGKTANLAQIARMLVDAGERVLVLAHANVAVDVAMLRIADAFHHTTALSEGRVIRVGAPHHPDALRREEILLEGVLARRDPEGVLDRRKLEARRRELGAQLRAASADDDRDALASELTRVRAQIAALREEHKRLEEVLIRQASVVGATLSRLVLSSVIWRLQPDAVVLDEASMASTPWLLAAATRARKRLVILGDFRQLPPVFISKKESAAKWLGRDAFDISGVRRRLDAGETDERVTLLDTQYRMAKPIGDAVSDLAYGGLLRTDQAAGEQAALLADGEPHPGESLLLVDTSLLRSSCQVEAKPGSFSRVNILHLALALSLARVLGRSSALISPYRAQARLLAAGVRDLQLADATGATVHRFQGSERHVVILDLVDAHPEATPSKLTGADLDLALRLVNVGLSRARGKAILVADKEVVEDRFAPNSAVRRALSLCETYGTAISPTARDVTEAFPSGEIEWSDDWAHVAARLGEDIATARRSVTISATRDFELPQELVEKIEGAATRGLSVTVLGPARLIDQFEESPADVRLLGLPGFFACVDHCWAYVAGRQFTAAARVSGPRLAALVESMLVGGLRRREEGGQSALPGATGELPPAPRSAP
jgi:hypothetical protein